jgi:predicted XRE-type DNA-binding protein
LCGVAKWVDPVPALKRRVADELLSLTDGWSQSWAAWYMDCPQSRVSDLRRGHLERMSLERMIRCLSHLGRAVEITTTRGTRTGPNPHEEVDRSQLGGRGRRAPERGYSEADSRE